MTSSRGGWPSSGRQNVRVSKVELTEMLLWELADADIEAIVVRLGYFRSHAPR